MRFLQAFSMIGVFATALVACDRASLGEESGSRSPTREESVGSGGSANAEAGEEGEEREGTAGEPGPTCGSENPGQDGTAQPTTPIIENAEFDMDAWEAIPPIRQVEDGTYVGRDGMRLIEIPEGEFWYRLNDSDEDSDELRYLERFFIDETEVTLAMYQGCVDAGVCTRADGTRSAMPCVVNMEIENPEVMPINCVSFYQAQTYCQFVGRRLPLREEWEKAVRGTDRRGWPWGDEPPWDGERYRMNYHPGRDDDAPGTEAGDDGFEGIAPVRSFSTDRSPW